VSLWTEIAARCEVCGGYHVAGSRPPAPVVLQAAKTLEHLPRMLSRTDAPRLIRELQQTRVTQALAEVGDELVESVLVRFRHEGVAGFAAWHNGVGQGVTLLRPMPRQVTIEQLRIELGLLQLQYVTCELPQCFQEIRATAQGRPRAHKNRAGQKCTLGRVLLRSPWFVGPER
jgi:hypothetical protein